MTPDNSGYDHGCDDAGLDRSDRYINEPRKGPDFHTGSFMRGYNEGFDACSGGGQASHGNSGLRVIVTVENVPAYVVGEEAGITITSADDISVYRAVMIPVASSFFTELQFAPGDVSLGEPISACVYINNELNACGQTANSEEKKPELVDIYLQGSGAGPNESPPDRDGSGPAAAADIGRYYEGFDWQGVCMNPLVRNYISQPCEVLVTSDGNALTSQGKQAMENILCPQGPSILSTIELFYEPIPSNLKNELANTCDW